ncbi:non-specific lipid transfer protein GPI-anchored 20 [Salvia miltiorrhiza]|uniref:non-specific lipid transfer protein GPI-anchored 20 n=1 Tax=Salvia miltiorrhiza TaxID=226208 RepID=UPI0025AD7E8D|nr:non-specific lipid transfer protein GPI-anchored 20 [Salvia miltiorrhiza]
MASQLPILALALVATALLSRTSAQITTPCTPSMITTFTPCMNFVTNSSLSGTSPPAECCNSLKSLMSSGKDCLCLIVTGSVPFNVPLNRTLAISLPRACNMPGVPLQCKADGAPVPAPAPAASAPSLSPNAAPSPSVSGLAPPEALSPQGEETPAPPAPGTAGDTPTSTTGSRAGVTPSAAQPSYRISPLHLVAVLAAMALKY